MATLFFSSSNWTDFTPFGLDQDSYGGDNKKFNRLTTTVELPSTDHKIVKVSISQSVSPGYDIGYITFTSPDGSILSTLNENTSDNLFTPVISVTADDQALFTHTRWFETNSYNGVTTDILVNVNGPERLKTTLLNLHIDIGANLNYSNANEEVNVIIDCDYITPVEHTAGLHPYSPYDAKDGSSTYQTKVWRLASLTPGTYLYSDALMTKPALPYYYGIGSTVYQVGEELDRNYGTVLKVKVKPRLFAQPKTEYRYTGPTSNWYQKGKKRKEPTTKLIRSEWHDDSSYDYSPMNIEPFVPSVGKISRTYANASIPQPSVYRYYVTSDTTSGFKAAEKWRYYDLSGKKHYIMNGGFNALYHLGQAYSNSLTSRLNDGNYAIFIDGNVIQLLVQASKSQEQEINEGVLIFSSVLLATEIPGLIAVIAGKKAVGGYLSSTIFAELSTTAAATIVSVIVLVIIIVLVLINIFKKTWLIEPLPSLKNVFSSNPTISNGDNFYKKDNLATEIDTGTYYSNGLETFLYSGTVSGKSYYYVNGLIGFDFQDGNSKIIRNEKPLGLGIAFDQVFDSTENNAVWERLITLPYEAGKPVPGKTVSAATVYTSAAASANVSYNVGAFERVLVNSVELEEGLLTSYVSQADADAKATIMLSASRAYITGSSTPGDLENEYVVSSSLFYFTHTIKVENNPKVLPLFWTGSLTAGTDLYYDEGGRNKVLNGYYSTGSAGANYRDFFLVESGSILKSEVMATAGSTNTVSGQPVDTSNLDFTSGWAISDESKSTVYSTTNKVINTHLYDTSKLLANNLAKRIIVSGSNRVSDSSTIKVYAGTGVSSTGSFNSQTTGWYTDITRWAPGQQREVLPESVYSQPTKTLRPFFREDCTWQENANERGVYVEFRSASAFTAPQNPVDLAFEVRTATGVVGTYRTTVPGDRSRHFVPIIDGNFEPNQYFTSITLSEVFSPNPNRGVSIYTGSAILSFVCSAPAGGSETVFISQVRYNCDDLCWQTGDTSYLVNNSSDSTEAYANITEGTYITDVEGSLSQVLGYIAVAASSTQTSDTSNVKILEVDNFGFVTTIINCSGGACTNPL